MTHALKTERYIHCLASITKSLSAIVSVLCYKQPWDWDHGKQMLTGDFVRGASCVILYTVLIHWNSNWAATLYVSFASAGVATYELCKNWVQKKYFSYWFVSFYSLPSFSRENGKERESGQMRNKRLGYRGEKKYKTNKFLLASSCWYCRGGRPFPPV